jgi:hypothetical protein
MISCGHHRARPGRTNPGPAVLPASSRWPAGTLAAAGTIPERTMNVHAILVISQGHHPANHRSAIPTRVYESGSGHGHDAAPAGHPTRPRSPPVAAVTAKPADPPLRPQGRCASLGDGACGPALAPGASAGPRAGKCGRPEPAQATAVTAATSPQHSSPAATTRQDETSCLQHSAATPTNPPSQYLTRRASCKDLTGRFI